MFACGNGKVFLQSTKRKMTSLILPWRVHSFKIKRKVIIVQGLHDLFLKIKIRIFHFQ